MYVLLYTLYQEDEDDGSAARLPKAGAYTDSPEAETPEKFSSRHSLTLKVSNGKIVRYLCVLLLFYCTVYLKQILLIKVKQFFGQSMSDLIQNL